VVLKKECFFLLFSQGPSYKSMLQLIPCYKAISLWYTWSKELDLIRIGQFNMVIRASSTLWITQTQRSVVQKVLIGFIKTFSEKPQNPLNPSTIKRLLYNRESTAAWICKMVIVKKGEKEDNRETWWDFWGVANSVRSKSKCSKYYWCHHYSFLVHGFNFLVYFGWWLVFLFLGLYQY
jgi:hypothetical protein